MDLEAGVDGEDEEGEDLNESEDEFLLQGGCEYHQSSFEC